MTAIIRERQFESFIETGRWAAQAAGLSKDSSWYVSQELHKSLDVELFDRGPPSEGGLQQFVNACDVLPVSGRTLSVWARHNTALRLLVLTGPLRLAQAYRLLKNTPPLPFYLDLGSHFYGLTADASRDRKYKIEIAPRAYSVPAGNIFSDIAPRFGDLSDAIWEAMQYTTLGPRNSRDFEILWENDPQVRERFKKATESDFGLTFD